MSSRVWRVAQWVLAAAIVGFAAREIVRQWGRLSRQPVAWDLRPGSILLALLVVWVMYGVLVWAWRVMLSGWGEQLAPLPATRIWTVSSLGKYVPGKVWAIAGMAVMAQRAGVAPWAATASAVMLQALAVGTGALVAAASGSTALSARYPWIHAVLLALIVASAGGLALLAWPAFVRRLLALARVKVPVAVTPGAGPVALGAVANLVAWCGYGASLWLLAHGIAHVPAFTLPRAVVVFTVSYLAGLLFLPAPGGLGVREGVFVILLDGIVGPATAIALALASRILLTVAEFGAAAPFLLWRGPVNHGPERTVEDT